MSEKSINVDLETPIKDGEKEITTIEMRQPLLGDLVDVEDTIGGDNAFTLAFISVLSGISKDALRTLTLPDYRKIDKAMRPFINPQKALAG